MGDDPRKRILERRARFVAAAIASAGLAGCERPQSCLQVITPVPEAMDAGKATNDASEVDTAPDATAATPPQPCLDVAPMPCLSPMPPPPPDAGATKDTGSKAGGTSKPDAGPPPMPCLKVAPPTPCLDMPSP